MAGIPAFGGENQGGSLFQAGALNAHGLRNDFATETFCVHGVDVRNGQLTGDVAHTVQAGYHAPDPGGTPHVLAVHGTQDPDLLVEQAHTLGRNSGQENAVMAFTQNSRSEVRHINGDGQIIGALAAEAGAQQQNYLAAGSSVRRLTPVECERLQGFSDDYTLIPWRGKPADECPDGPRYKAIGNSKAVPVVRWIGRRIQRELERAA